MSFLQEQTVDISDFFKNQGFIIPYSKQGSPKASTLSFAEILRQKRRFEPTSSTEPLIFDDGTCPPPPPKMDGWHLEITKSVFRF